MPKPSRRALITAAVLASLPALQAPAATKFWISANLTGNWSDDTKWSATGTTGANNTTHPVDGDAVNFSFTDASARTITANQNVTGAGLISLQLSNAASGSVTLSQSAGVTLNTAALSLAGANVLYSNQGALAVTNGLSIATTAGATTAASFSQASGTVTAGSINVGTASAGVFGHNAGVVTVATLSVGAGFSGAYTMTAAGTAALTVTAAESLGTTAASSGTFIQSTGTHSVLGSFAMGAVPGATGTYSLSGTGTLNTASGPAGQNSAIGAGGVGNFIQTGGTHSFGAGSDTLRTLAVGTASSNGIYNLSGVTSALTVTGFLTVGGFSAGTGAFAQSAGSVSATRAITVGSPTAANATYTLTGGAVSSPAIVNYATFSAPAGTIGTGPTVFTNYGSLTLTANTTFNAQLVNFGTVSLPATFTAANGYTTYVPITLAATQRVIANAQPFDNESNLTLTGTTLTGTGGFTNNNFAQGYATLAGTGPFTNNGQLTTAGGPLVLASTAGGYNNANIDLSAGNNLQLAAGSLTNYGTITLNSGVVNGAAPLYNAGGTVTGRGSLLVPFTNAGTLLPFGGTLLVPAGFVNSGTARLVGPGAALAGGAIANTGTLTGDGAVANPVINDGRVEPAGYLTLTGPLTNSPLGTLAVPANSTLAVTNPLASSTNAGLISLAGGTFLHVNQPLTNTGQISGFGTLQTASLTNAGALVLANGTSTLTGPITNLPAATIDCRFNPTLFTSPLTNNGTFNILSANVTFAGGGSNLPNAPTGVVSSADHVASPTTLTSPNGISGQGSLVVSPASSLTTAYLRQSSLTSSGTITIRPAAQGGSASSVDALTLLAGTLDLADTDLVTLTPATTIRGYIAAGLLISSTASTDPQHRLALGYADASSTLVTLTYYGDANLDGKINADDYALLDRGYAKHLTTWQSGDFNYDGTINNQDYLLIDRVFIQQGAPLSPTFLAQRESQFGSGYVSTLLASVPEPAVGCALAVLPLASRRKRK